MRIEDVDSLLHSAHALQDPSEAVDRILLHVARITPRIGDLVQLHANDYPIAFARDYREFQNLQDLGGEMGFLDVQEHGIRPTPEGWYRIAELRVRSVDPTQAFVAMSYHDGLNTAYLEGIRPALEETGYTSIRVDFIEHNDKIGDRIVAEIRKSALIVADFTGHRPNVYFEAGLALGLGRHVIWTCHADAIEEAHFDTRQYNHIVWHDPADLRTRLRNRIEATIPIPSHIARTH